MALGLAVQPLTDYVQDAVEMGTRTFLLTDLEGSTALWERHPDAMDQALVRMESIIGSAVAANGGTVHKSRGEGDSVFCTFDHPAPAIVAARDFGRALAQSDPDGIELRVRAGIHTGEVSERDGDFFGGTVNRVARLRGIGAGGQVLISAKSVELASGNLPDDIALFDLGEHGLRDLSRPEHVFELRAAGLLSGFPPLASVGAYPNNLPVQVSTFVGRVADLEALGALVPHAPLVTLAAVGGAGKTRLALHAAADLVDLFPDGAWLVRLGDLVDPSLLVQTLAETLGVYDRVAEAAQGDGAKRAMEERALELLSRRKVLIVLDNCEHLIAESARIVDRIIHRCADVRIIATSREPLGVEGERVFAVQSLSTDGAMSPAARMFVDRARLARPDFEIDDGNIAMVTAILERLDGLPLAIELAASRLRSLSVESIASRLDDAFRILTGGARAVERHRTLEATITWSYDLLDDGQKTLFRRLAMFAGGFTLQAAESVCGFEPLARDDVLDLLSDLVDRSLVVYDDVADRYRLLHIVGQFATRELAQSDERADVGKRHTEFCLPIAFSAGFESLIHGRTSSIVPELENFRAAVSRAIDENDRITALQMLTWFGWAWIELGLTREGAEWTRTALALPGAAPALDAQALAFLGMCHSFVGDWRDWDDVSRRAEAAAMALPASVERGLGLGLLALGACLMGELERASDLVGAVAGDPESLGPIEVAVEWISILIAMLAGDGDAVRALVPGVRERSAAIDWSLTRQNCDWALAITCIWEMNPDEARALLEPIVATRPESSWSGEWWLVCLAEAYRLAGDRDGAIALVRSVLQQSGAVGAPMVAWFALIQSVVLVAELGKIREAGELQAAVEGARQELLGPRPIVNGWLRWLIDAADALLSGAKSSDEYRSGYAAGKRLSLTEAVDRAAAVLSEPTD